MKEYETLTDKLLDLETVIRHMADPRSDPVLKELLLIKYEGQLRKLEQQYPMLVGHHGYYRQWLEAYTGLKKE